MAEKEDYFPRGGKKPTTTHFRQSENFLGVAEKGDKKKKRNKKKSEDDDGYLSDEVHEEIDQSFKNCAIWLNYKVVKEGFLMLGRVNQVLDTKLQVSLPCRMNSVVMACHISEAYNKLLEAYVNDQVDKVIELSQMFKPGQYVAVKVLEVGDNKIMGSLMPQHIYSNRTIVDLHKGALLQASVSSVEDHGYVMDIGIPNTRTFLPKDSTNPDIELEVGMLTWVAIQSNPAVDSSVIKLSNQLANLQRAVQKSKTNTLYPGTALEFVVDKPLDNGIEGHILDKTDKTTAYIQRHQADTVKGKKPGLGQKIRARLLYVVPPKNFPFLTMKGIFDSSYPDLTEEQKFKEGDIIEEAKVLKIMGRSIHLKLGEGSTGVLSLRRVAVHEDLTDEQILLKSYPIGSKHKVRILCYNISDYMYSVSDDASVLNIKYFTLSQLNVGDIVTATITQVADNYLRVTVGRVYGYVPQSHMTDTGIFIDPKKPSNSKLSTKKFKEGQEVQARVLSIEPNRHRLILSLKPSLMDEDLVVLKSYQEAQVGKMYTGVVAQIKDYLLVSFFNNVMGYIPRKMVSTEPLASLTDAFHQGQIVKCTIISVNPEANKMTASLISKPFTEIRKRDKKRKIKDKGSASLAKKLKIDSSNEDSDAEENIEINKESKTKNCKKNKNKKGSYDTDNENVTEEINNLKIKNKKIGKETGEQNLETDEELQSINENNKNKRKRDKNKGETTVDTDIKDTIAENKKAKKKKKDKITTDVYPENDDEENDTNESKKKTKDKTKTAQKQKETNEVSEESDAIETDIHEDSDQVLTPEDQNLIDLSDCVTQKKCKKRVVSLIKYIKARTNRISRIESKIEGIEKKGLDAKNKKFHTAMHTEKLVIEERLKKLMEALTKAQEKHKEFGITDNNDYKKKKELKLVKKLEENILEKPNKKDIKEKEKEEIIEKTDKIKKVKVVKVLKPAVDIPSAKDFWSTNSEIVNDVKEEESSSSEEEGEEKPKKKKKKLSVAEKAAKAREEEERIREQEKKAIESEKAPQSSDQFERALLAEPNCSQLWIAYMAFHLQATEIDKARAVGKKALNTINFREEAEKLNVWLALLNLEHRFGTKETQQKTLEDALQMNDTYQVHSKLLDILVDTTKHQELVSLVELMMRKYRQQPKVYVKCGEACFMADLVDKARYVMQKGIAALEKKEHVNLLVRFAQLERSRGDRERAEALFEQVLAVYPQRVDVCAAYIDMLMAAKDVEHVRQVMERMTSQKLPARKMKVLYKKWIEAEEKIGDHSQVENIRQRALEFIDKAQF